MEYDEAWSRFLESKGRRLPGTGPVDGEEAGLCEHLSPVLEHLESHGARVTARGRTWTRARYWVYVDAVLDCERLRETLGLDPRLEIHENTDPRSGTERGLYCPMHGDGVMGPYPPDAPDARVIG